MIQRVNQMGDQGKNPKPEILAAPTLGPVGIGGTEHLCHCGYRVPLWDPGGYSPRRQGFGIDMKWYSFSFIDEDAEDQKDLSGHPGSQRHSGCLAGLC